MTRMLQHTEHRTDEYHLMVRTTADQQKYAHALYKELGFTHVTDKNSRLYKQTRSTTFDIPERDQREIAAENRRNDSGTTSYEE